MAGWVSSSSWVSDGVWCDAPAACAPLAAAHSNRQSLYPVGSEEGGGLDSKLTICLKAVKKEEEEEEEEEGGPQHG